MAQRDRPPKFVPDKIAEVSCGALGRNDAIGKGNTMASGRDSMAKLVIISAALHQRFEPSDLGKTGSCRRHCGPEREADALEAPGDENARGKVGRNANRFQIRDKPSV